eukprot:10808417-Lingulodinium_polyedra.AAC.1
MPVPPTDLGAQQAVARSWPSRRLPVAADAGFPGAGSVGLRFWLKPDSSETLGARAAASSSSDLG